MPPWAQNPTLARISYNTAARKFEAGTDFGVVCLEAGSVRQDLPIFTNAKGAIELDAESADPSRPPVSRTDFPKIPGAFLLHNVLSRRECDQIVKMVETMGFTEDAPVSLGRNIRQNENCVWVAERSLNDAIFERCHKLLPPDVNGGEVLGLNMRWRLYKYQPEDIFRIHTDGAWPGSGIDDQGRLIPDIFEGDRFSQLSWIIYLNDEFNGGGTRFFFPKEGVKRGPRMSLEDFNVEEVPAERGAAICFFHGEHELSPLHEGALVQAGTKYIIRSDVLYRRVRRRPKPKAI